MNKTDEKPKDELSIKKSTHTTIGKNDSRNRFTKGEYMVAPESSNRSIDTKRGSSDVNTERRSDGVVVYRGPDETSSINNNISNF